MPAIAETWSEELRDANDFGFQCRCKPRVLANSNAVVSSIEISTTDFEHCGCQWCLDTAIEIRMLIGRDHLGLSARVSRTTSTLCRKSRDGISTNFL